MELSI